MSKRKTAKQEQQPGAPAAGTEPAAATNLPLTAKTREETALLFSKGAKTVLVTAGNGETMECITQDHAERFLEANMRRRTPSLYVLVPALNTDRSGITLSAARALVKDLPDGKYMIVTVRDEFNKVTETVTTLRR